MESMAMFIAKVIHNAIDDFHSKHLSDDQIRELDSIIKDAIYTALYASKSYSKSSAAKAFITVNIASIPKHWQEPKLLDNYQRLQELYKEKIIQDSITKLPVTEETYTTKPKDDLIETIKYRRFEIRVFKFPWEPTFFFTATFADNGKAQVADVLPNCDEEYADAATAVRETKAAIDEYLRKKGKRKSPKRAARQTQLR